LNQTTNNPITSIEEPVPKINIGGTGISDITLDETMDLFDVWIQKKQQKRICVTPVNCVVWANKNVSLQQIYNTADLTLCDGVPLIWASLFLGQNKIRGRVTGLDLLPQYIQRCHQHNFSMFFLGGAAGVAEAFKVQLEGKYPGIKIVGTYSPPFANEFSEEENRKMVQLINNANPDVLWVSLTAPKQDLWINQHIHSINSKINIGIGAALDVAVGKFKRAPVWMQKTGLEWLYRFIKEPKRLFRRYFIEAPAIVPILLKQKFGDKV
jgi:N-acetylglucosaminyldiphosphoundecaprenol N-acetyl-beta-D-mannosaminyltransferase